MTTPSAPPTPAPEVLFDQRNGVGHILLNRPAALNALSTGMLRAMHEHLSHWEHSADIHAVLIRGEGAKAFCAGGDIKALYLARQRGDAIHETFFTTEYPVNHLIAEYAKPYVAVLDGVVMGGGMGISQFATHRLITERARLGMPETGIGLIPDVGGTYFLSRMPGELGTYIALTGATVTVSDALLSSNRSSVKSLTRRPLAAISWRCGR
jgi:enoyl-CoA hydratase/carnithine racemase